MDQINHDEIIRCMDRCKRNTVDIENFKESTDKRFDELKADIADVKQKTDAIHDLSTNVALMAQGLTTMKDDIKEIKTTGVETSAKVRELENRPANDAEKLLKSIKLTAVTAITSLVVTGIVAAIVAFMQ